MQVDDEARALLARYCKPAILLHRPYPPQPSSSRNSFFGGLPNLPADLEWPRTSQGDPLHFLCQIDLSEIGWETELPRDGLLFFFGHEGDGIGWGDDEPEDDCRVLYRRGSGDLPPERSAPDDLGPAGNSWGEKGYFGELLLPGEAPRTTHTKWPIQFLKIETYPDLQGLPAVDDWASEDNDHFIQEWNRVRQEASRLGSRVRNLFGKQPSVFARMAPAPPRPTEAAVWDRYKTLLPLERGLAYERATGLQIERDPSWTHEKRDAEALLNAGLFPWLAMDLSYFARFALYTLRLRLGAGDGLDQPEPIRKMRAWLDRSLSQNQTLPLSPEDRQRFVDWLNQLQVRDAPPGMARIYHLEIRDAVMCTIRELAHDPALFAAIPELVRETYAKYFATAELDGSMINLRPRFYFSQMLGHPMLSQSTWRADDDEACLLRLSSDYRLGWTFADMGEAVFHLPVGALAERKFDQVRGILEGG